MIISFKIKNVYSYKDEAEFNTLASGTKVKTRYLDNYINLSGYDILKTGVIVGENAGGKSNFIKGIAYFKSLFEQTSGDIKPLLETVFNVLPANLEDINTATNNRIQEFEIILTSLNDYIYKYELRISSQGIENEKLSYTDNKEHAYKDVFEYSVSYEENSKTITLNIPGNVKIKNAISNQLNEGKAKGLIVNSLSLLGIEHTTEFIKAIEDINIQRNVFDLPIGISNQLKPYLEIMKTNEFLKIFQLVDSSIIGIEIDDDFPLLKSIVERRLSDGSVSKRFIGYDSTGVKNFLLMAITIYNVVYNNKVVFSDEMDSTFNPILTSKVIAFIHSFETKGQFIFTTHNIFNLTFQTFMKEQMYIVEKNKDTLESTIYSLADFTDLRYDSNERIYEYYMKGVLGGVDNA